MVLNNVKVLVFGIIVVLIISCQGTHGHIRGYQANCSKEQLEKTFFLLGKEESNITFVNNTDRSDINRPGYFDVEFIRDGVKTVFKFSYFGGDKYWKKHPDDCIIAIIEIDGLRDHHFGWFSSKKREGLKLFENEITPLLENKACLIYEIDISKVPTFDLKKFRNPAVHNPS